MPQKQARRAVIHQLHRHVCAGVVTKMSDVRQNPALQKIGIRSVLQHADIMVGFQHDKIAAENSAHDLVCHMTDVRCHRHPAFIGQLHGKAAAFVRVVRRWERTDTQIADRNVFADLHKLTWEIAVQRTRLVHALHGAAGGIDRQMQL